AGEGAPQRALPAQEYPPAVEESLATALAAYDEIRALLAADELEGLAARASRLAQALRLSAEAAEEGSPAAANLLDEAARTADSLAETDDLATARAAFAEVSRALLPVVGADPEVAAGWRVFECPMTEGFNKWMQTDDGAENPFMGQEMLTCAKPAEWATAAPATAEEAAAHARFAHGGEGDGDEIAYYTCSMHPSVRSKDPGNCPICSMELTPVTRAEVESGVVIIDAARRQRIGVTTAAVERRAVPVTIRAVGKVVYDENRLAEVSVKYRGWIGDLAVNETGQAVRKGQTLFTLYSPELYAAQEEYLAALDSQRAARGTGAPDRADYLVDASRKRLRLWDLQPWQLDSIAETRQPVQYIPIVSPVSGHVVEKMVVQGASVEPGMKLFRIAGLDRVWVEAEVYESELPLVEVGQAATVTLSYVPGKRYTGRVTFIYPYLDDATRTGRVRVELANPNLELKPDMYANVLLERTAGEALVVPEDAVLYAGDREFVFVDMGEGRLRPQRVETGLRVGDHVEIRSGLEAGDVIVTSGNFLIAAESRLKRAIEQWGEDGAVPAPVRPVDPHAGH
ncbi:MAG TPA: efflux RND transporter periplasmic adaptor subunit, partial [Thermoanaerobaculia bacterium]